MTAAIDVFDAPRELHLEPGATLVAVLGYSDRSNGDLHPICATRLAAAREAADGAGAVVFSGWSRRRGAARSEAELMVAAWDGPDCPLVSDPHARITAENAAHVGTLARALSAGEVRVVTSSLHQLRASLLFRAALRGSGARLSVRTAPGPRSVRFALRELLALPLVPFQLALVMRRGGSPSAPAPR
jgi:uncharacterized SAM-binding protein YcdF (DUF218 family)